MLFVFKKFPCSISNSYIFAYSIILHVAVPGRISYSREYHWISIPRCDLLFSTSVLLLIFSYFFWVTIPGIPLFYVFCFWNDFFILQILLHCCLLCLLEPHLWLVFIRADNLLLQMFFSHYSVSILNSDLL